jgi:hypothetical protein
VTIRQAAAAALVLMVAQAQAADRLAAQLDRPSAVRKVPPKSGDDPNGQIECTYYRDLMVRESGTDTPDPNDATLIPIAAGAARPVCDATRHDGDITMKTQGYSFVGRKNRFLLFSATDPNGAIPFMVLDEHGGKLVFQDGTPADRGIQTIAVENGALHLRYTRGFNAPCSMMQDTKGCWSRLVAEGKVPPDMAHSVPSAGLCAASYKAAHATPDDPSVISYDVDTVVGATGNARVVPRGSVTCSPMP